MSGPPPDPGGTGGIGAEPPPAPLMHTPSNLVGFVPHGQLLSAAAGDATTSGAAATATAHPKTRTPRFTVTIKALRTSRPTRNSLTRERSACGHLPVLTLVEGAAGQRLATRSHVSRPSLTSQ